MILTKYELSTMPLGALMIVGSVIEMLFYWPHNVVEWLIMAVCWIYACGFWLVVLTKPSMHSTYIANLCISAVAFCLYVAVWGRI